MTLAVLVGCTAWALLLFSFLAFDWLREHRRERRERRPDPDMAHRGNG